MTTINRMPDDTLSNDDKALFRAAMQDVTPLKKNNRMTQSRLNVKSMTMQPLKAFSEKAALPPSDALYLSDAYTEDAGPETVLSFYRYPLNPKQSSALRKGRFYFDNRLDLHGCSKEQAKEMVIATILLMRKKRVRHLLLIHGKGGMHQTTSVLKSAVNHWLRQIPDVLAFHSAHPKDGGNGALYVLLRHSQP